MNMKTAPIVALAILLAFPENQLLAKPKGSAQKPAAQQNVIKHVVQRGETLSSIAEAHYGNSLMWVKLQQDNPFITDPDRLEPGEVVMVLDASRSFSPGAGQTSMDPGGKKALLAWLPNLSGISLFGRSLYQIILILMTWFLTHFSLQGIFVWFAAHLAFVKDVSFKKSMKATLQSEALAFVCMGMAVVIGLMLLYVGTTSPGNPATPELLSMAEDYVKTPTGIIASGLLLVALYGFLAIRFIPPAFGIQSGRAVAVVMLAVLLPHLVGFYLVGHRMGLIN